MICSLSPLAPLNTTDHYLVVRKVLLTVRPQWRNIGLALGIPLFKLNEFSGSLEEKIDKMLEVWLNQDHTSTPTWEALVDALRDDTVEGGKPVAADIETKYLGRGQSVGQGRYSQECISCQRWQRSVQFHFNQAQHTAWEAILHLQERKHSQ